ncbi:MAG TPA: hypothetical protein VK524_23480, partial [Polyangiaceae bacterium]|nr:hypothetical protein [Polyangiaceae bacterium]
WTGIPFVAVDCAAAPGACRLVVEDIADPENTRVSLPLTIQSPPVPHGTAVLDLQSPLVPDMRARVEGAGWAPETNIQLWWCKGAGFEDCIPRGALPTDSAGNFRWYPEITGVFSFRPEFDCTVQAKLCSLVIADDRALTSSAVRIPLVFDTGAQIDVVSRYESKWQALLDQGTSLSGLSAPEFQKTGVGTFLWLLGQSGQETSTHLPALGSLAISSRYGADDYRALSAEAARFDYTLVELQKTGTLFYAWILAGMPPLPP